MFSTCQIRFIITSMMETNPGSDSLPVLLFVCLKLYASEFGITWELIISSLSDSVIRRCVWSCEWLLRRRRRREQMKLCCWRSSHTGGAQSDGAAAAFPLTQLLSPHSSVGSQKGELKKKEKKSEKGLKILPKLKTGWTLYSCFMCCCCTDVFLK